MENDKTKRQKPTKKEQGMGHGRRQKGEEKNEERKEKKKQTNYITVTLGALQALHSNVPSSFPVLIHAPGTGVPLQLELLSLLGDR